MSAALYTVAVPELAPAGQAFVDALRAQHHPRHAVLPAHITLVFACRGLAESDSAGYRAHVAAVAQRSRATAFTCRYAMRGADDASPAAYAFLVPDEGFAALSLLHDALYTGVLASRLRLDLPYTPHITVGEFADAAAAQRVCSALNETGVHLAGRIAELQVWRVDGERLDVLERLPLQR